MSSATYFSTVISQQGMSYVMQASPTGPLIDISYFVPVYDYRIDPDISIDGTPLSAFSAVAQELVDTSATSATGEHIWFLPSDLGIKYDLSDAYALIREVAGNYQSEPEEILDGALQTNNPSVGVNLLNGTPISDTISADTMYYDLQTNTWKLSNYSLVLGNNNIMPSETTVDNYYRVADYHPVGSGDSLRGSYTCRINSNNGKFKFNKIALYCVLRNGDGTLYNGDGAPKFFGECYIQEPIIKSSFGSAGFDDIVCNVQINITSVTSAFDNVFYSTSGDYWQRWINSVHYPFKVSVGHFDDNVEPDAVVHVKRAKVGENSTIDNDIPHLRLDYDADTYASFKMTSSSNYSPDDVEMGDLVIGANVGPTYCGKVLTIRPAVDSTVNLGKPTHPFGRMWLDELTMNDDINAHDIIPSEDVTYSLGTANLKWGSIYASFVNIDILKSNSISHNIIYSNASISPLSANQFYLGDGIDRWKKIYSYELDVLGTFSCQDIIPKNSGVYSLGNSSYAFKSIYTTEIRSKYIGTKISGSDINLLANLLPLPGTYINLGSLATPFNQIFVTMGVFDKIYEYGRSIANGEWIDVSTTTIIHEYSTPGINGATDRCIKYSLCGKIAFMHGRFSFKGNNSVNVLRMGLPFKINLGTTESSGSHSMIKVPVYSYGSDVPTIAMILMDGNSYAEIVRESGNFNDPDTYYFSFFCGV